MLRIVFFSALLLFLVSNSICLQGTVLAGPSNSKERQERSTNDPFGEGDQHDPYVSSGGSMQASSSTKPCDGSEPINDTEDIKKLKLAISRLKSTVEGLITKINTSPCAEILPTCKPTILYVFSDLTDLAQRLTLSHRQEFKDLGERVTQKITTCSSQRVKDRAQLDLNTSNSILRSIHELLNDLSLQVGNLEQLLARRD